MQMMMVVIVINIIMHAHHIERCFVLTDVVRECAVAVVELRALELEVEL